MNSKNKKELFYRIRTILILVFVIGAAHRPVELVRGSNVTQYILSEKIPSEGPYYITIDSKGSLYVTERDNDRVKKINSTGIYLIISAGSNDGQVDQPDGIDIDVNDNIYVADAGNNRIQKFDSEGKFISKITGSKESGSFSHPMGVAVDVEGNIYVADSRNKQIQKFDFKGTFITSWKSGFKSPESITVDSSGNVYVADEDTNIIQKFDSAGKTSVLGSMGSGDGQFDDPEDLTVDSFGNVYVADSGNNRIQKFDAEGNLVTKWETWETLLDKFDHPRGVVVDGLGNVYVADTENNRILKFAPTGNLKVTVHTSNESPLERATISSTKVPSGQPLSGTSDASGVYTFNGVPAGEYVIQASKTDYVTGTSGPIKVIAGDTLEIKITLLANSPENQAPKALDDRYSMIKDTTLTINAPGILTNDSDPEGKPITAVLVNGPEHESSFSLRPNGSFTYTPESGYLGSDKFSYKANDGTADSNVVIVTIEIKNLNNAPVANPDGPYETKKNTALTIPSNLGVLKNDVDADGDPLTAIKAADPSHGTATLNPDGSFLYTPAADYTGTDSFTYKISDRLVESAVVVVSINIKPNRAPIGNLDKYKVLKNSVLVVAAPGVLANDTDPDGDPLTAEIFWDPPHGVLSLNSDGSFTYTPQIDYHGPDEFYYRVKDGSAKADVQVKIHVQSGRTFTLTIDQDMVQGEAQYGGGVDPPEGVYTFDEDEKVTVTAYPNTNKYSFSQWKYNSIGKEGNPITITMSDNIILKPEFIKIGCMIATATYGGFYAPEVVYMRHVRDDLIGSNDVGKVLVSGWNNFYYSWSPPIAYSISRSPLLRSTFTMLLLPLLGTMHVVALIFDSLATISPELASMIGFVTAAVITTTIYIILPILLLRDLFRRIKKNSLK